MAFREKTAWISVLLTLAIYGRYFSALVSASGRGDGAEFLGLLIESAILFVVVFVVLSIVVSALAPREADAPADEREKLIGLKEDRVGFYVLTLGAVMGMGAAFLGQSSFWIANVLFLSLVAAELAKDATRILLYRVGM